jgi:hypothetical protein
MTRVVALVALVVACGKQDAPPPASPPPAIAESELKRGVDACEAYVQQICDCATHSATEQQACALAKGLPDAIAIARRIAQNPKAEREDALQAADSIRKTVKQCIEEAAALATRGCSARD